MKYFFPFVCTLLISILSPQASNAAEKAKIKVFCVGDSITYGIGTTNPAMKSYPAQLQVLLGPDYEVKNLGNSGSTMLDDGDKPYKQQPEFGYALSNPADIYVIMLGTNDSKPKNWVKKDNFAASTKALVDAYLKISPKAKIYLCTPVFVSLAGNFGITNEIVHGEVAPTVKQAAADLNLDLIDLYPVLESHPETLPDRVHPNDEGAALMAQAVYEALSKK